MSAYYNEHDPKAAAWLRELIARELIAGGDVDERSVEDVVPNDLRGYTQCHFFAGIGGWSLALRIAGWPDSRPVWTGSCPCQPFSAAGKGAGFADERHLWPAWFHLIAQCRPAVVFGEQVASAAGHGWIDLVQADLEGQGYAVGHHVLGAHSVGAPHIRQRMWFVADSELSIGRPVSLNRQDGHHRANSGRKEAHGVAGARGEVRGLADSNGQRHDGIDSLLRPKEAGRRPSSILETSGCGAVGVALGDTNDTRLEGRRLSAERARELLAGAAGVAGHWSDADWLHCRDGKWRPVEPGTFPLAHGLPARVVRLRGYGNAIVPQVAAEFVAAAMESGIGAGIPDVAEAA